MNACCLKTSLLMRLPMGEILFGGPKPKSTPTFGQIRQSTPVDPEIAAQKEKDRLDRLQADFARSQGLRGVRSLLSGSRLGFRKPSKLGAGPTEQVA